MIETSKTNSVFLSELEILKKMELTATEVFLSQMFLILRDHARGSKKTNEKPVSELTLENIVDIVKGKSDNEAT